MRFAGLKRLMNNLAFILFNGDVLYTVLPIIVYAIVRVTYRRQFDDFLALPEWSFASIVFYGLSIRRTTELRRLYKSSLSYKLNIRIQVFVFLLIASVLALSLAIVVEGDPEANHRLIVLMQQIFFWLGIVSLTYTIFTERFILNALDKQSCFFFWEDTLTVADEYLYSFVTSVNSFDYSAYHADMNSNEQQMSEKERDELKLILQRLVNSIRLLNEAQGKLNDKFPIGK